jgi:peptidoglycan/xylan/chitin deacetylase (PgdA/CDA1 family)
VRWHDRLARLTAAEVEQEVDNAVRLFQRILGDSPRAFAAPGWQCTEQSLRVIDQRGFRYRSDTRGLHPYRPRAGGYTSSIAELPTTLPTLDEMLGLEGSSVAEITRFYLGQIARERLNVHTVHTEVEGGICLSHLDALLTRVRDLLPVCTLGEVAAALPPIEELPCAAVVSGHLRGRAGTVACQAPA